MKVLKFIAFSFALVFLSACSSTPLSVAPEHGAQFVLQTEINAPSERVWGILAHDYAQISEWAGLVDASGEVSREALPDYLEADVDAPVAGRWTENNLGKLREILVDYSEENQEFTFRADGLPGFMVWVTDRTVVEALSPERSKVSLHIHMAPYVWLDILSPLIQARFESGLQTVLDDLKVYAETGAISENKKQALTK